VEGHVVRARVIKTGKNNGIKNGKKYLKTRPRGGGLSLKNILVCTELNYNKQFHKGYCNITTLK